MGYKEYTEAKRGTSWKQKLKQTIDRLVITAKDYDDFLRLMQEAGYESKTGKYISFRAEAQERFTRSKTDVYKRQRHHWVIPAAYSCSKGLVMDFCMRTPEEDIRKMCIRDRI